MHTIKDIVKQLIGKSLDAYNTKYTKVVNSRIDNIVAQAGNDNTEIVDARIDSAGVTHTTLNNRILAETKMNDKQLIEYTGNNISAEDTTQGYLKDVEILGNTIQNEEDLADIKSVGKLQEDGTYKMSILSCNARYKHTISQDGTRFDFTFNEYIPSGVTITNLSDKPIRPILFTDGGVYDSDATISTKSTYIVPSGKKVKKITLYSHQGWGMSINYNLDDLIVIDGAEVSKNTISLPVQLEKVGDVSDRLYYDDVEKSWYIEKNIESYTITNYSRFLSDSSLSNVYRIYIDIDKNIGSGIKNIISSIIPYRQNMSWSQNEEGCYTDANAPYPNRIWFHINKSKISGDVETYFKNSLPVTIEYQLATPQKIVLPLSTQIALNSFFGTTHVYMESGEVEGTIKCKIPKSLGATVQSLNNKTDILSDRIEAIEGLKDSQNMKYETDKGYLVCKETKNGVIDDLKIEGKTLVNYISNFNNWRNMGSTTVSDDGASMTINATAWNKGREISKNLPSGNYIFRVTNPNKATIVVQDKTNARILFNGNEANIDFEFSILEDIELLIVCKNTSETGTYVVSNPILTTDKNFNNYFEGLMSVGEDVDKIEVLSRKEDGNLFDITRIVGEKEGGVDYTYDNNNVVTVKSNAALGFGNYMKFKAGKTYYFSGETSNIANVRIYPVGRYTYADMILSIAHEQDSFSGSYKCTQDMDVMFRFWKNTGLATISDVIVSTNPITEYTPYQSDKKQILFYNSSGELEPIQELHEWDSIEKHSDNKWYYHKRSGKVVLNGSENWNLNVQTDSTIRFQLDASYIKMAGNRNPIICDKFNLLFIYDTNHTQEGVFTSIGGSTLFINIDKSKLSSQDAEGFKQWLQANNVTVVYQLAEEEVYELAPLHLDSYANETLILCNSGAISPKMEFSITSHINELVKAYGERINLLEEKVYKYMVTQNRMQLASTYSADSVTFKVDYFSLCGDEENYDEDLYNLILNNILVGKDNYNYDKMFTMILDYASWNQISWEQFDILVGLMDMQHNPPVEEEITEDESIEETPVE